MITKHTPGPWWFAENQYTFAVGAGDREIAHVGQTDRMSVNLHDRSRANARLIAAAPDLLAALLECASVLPVAGRLHPKDLHALQSQIVAALARARGEG